MIYLFDESKRLTGIIAKEHVRTVRFSRERNSLYDIVAEIPVINYHQGERYNLHNRTKDAVFLGHYDLEDRFQLHKISLYDVDKGMIRIQAVHLFFDEAKAGAIIRERRYIDREVSEGARDAFAEIGWQMADFDVSPTRTYNFYNVSPLEARATLIETFGYEFDYWLDFDGKKISGKYFSVKRRIGEDSNKRYTYDKHTNTGHHVLSLRAEQDYSELYTAVIGRGRGEEYEDTGGYGRRIEFTDIAWSKPNNPLDKPIGSRVLVDPEATQAFGYVDGDSVKPRTAVVVFSDIEEQRELIEASYDWLVEHRQPKLLFDVNVADGDGLNLGDTVHIKYNEIGLNLAVRVGKVTEDLKTGERHVELGDVEYFSPGRSNREIKRSMAQDRRDAANRIFQLKQEFDENFDNRVNQMREDFEQALIDAHAEIQAAEQRMETLISTTRNDWTDTFDAEVAEIYRKADENYNRIETEITGVIDFTREEMEMEFNDSVQNARAYAETQAHEKATAVRSDLETVTSGHQGMIDELQTNVLSIDDFLGDKTVGLNEQLQDVRIDFEQQINNISTWHYNILRGTRFDEPDMYNLWSARGTIETSESIPFFRNVPDFASPYVEMSEEIDLVEGREYTFSIDYRTEDTPSINYVIFISRDGSANYYLSNRNYEGDIFDLTMDGGWRRTYVKFTPPRELFGVVRIGVNYNSLDVPPGQIDLRLPYLTETDRTQWLYHQLDNTQSMEEVTRRITELEDGREEFITRTEYDFETGEIEGAIRNIRETVDGRESIIQNHEDWILTNGASVIESAEGFQSKAWLADIHNPNILNFSDITHSKNYAQWDYLRASSHWVLDDEWLRVRAVGSNAQSYFGVYSPELSLIKGETYTVSFEAFEHFSDNTSGSMNYVFMTGSDITNIGLVGNLTRTPVSSVAGTTTHLYQSTFVAIESSDRARLLIGTRVASNGSTATFYFKEPKVELGDRATPYHNAHSMFNQRADSIALQVDDQESRIANFTVDLDGIAGTVADIEGDYIKQSSLEITTDYAQIGSMRIDGDTVGSLLRVSPSGIDAVAEAMRLSGDLLVDGDITALAVDAIEGNFARLWADEFEAITITGEHIETNTITAQHLTGADAILNYLMARLVFAEEVTSIVGNFVDVNAGNIVTSGLSANIILSSHINSSNALIEKLFSTSARIDTLISKTHFVNEIKATSIDAVYADLRSVNSEIMDTNILKADWIQGGNALLDKVFANTAMFERMMAKSGFVSTMSAITLDLHELTIWRPDGVAYVQNGVPKFSNPIDVKPWPSTSVEYDARNYTTSSRGSQTFERAYCEHAGRYAIFEFQPSMRWDSQHASTRMFIIVRPSTVPSGVNLDTFYREELTVYRDRSNSTVRFTVPLSAPTYGAMSFILEFGRVGDNTANFVQVRSNRCRISG